MAVLPIESAQSNFMPAKSTTRRKKAEDATLPEEASDVELDTETKSTSHSDPFSTLVKKIYALQSEVEKLQKDIAQTKEEWKEEQKIHNQKLSERDYQEDEARKKEREAYEYEFARRKRREEDEFADKKAAWEKELREQRETLNKEKQELLDLRKLVAGFENEKETLIKNVQENLREDLVAQFQSEKKMKDQEVKAKEDLLNLRIDNLTSENARLNREIEALKKTLDEATRQVKDIAVKVIESRGNLSKSQISESAI